MLKQSFIYLVLSILVVIFAKYAHLLIVYIDMLYIYINVKLLPFFNHSNISVIVRKTILLIFIPILLAAIPALFYRLIKGKRMPYFFQLTWCLWLIILLSNVLIRI